MAQRRRIPVENVERRQLDNLTSGLAPGGRIYRPATLCAWMIFWPRPQRERTALILALAQVEDPRNLGAAARTAAAAGAHGLVIPLRRAAPITGAAEKAAAGALDHIPVARVTNLRRCLTDLKAAGLWVMGADMDGDSLYYETDLTDPVALVVGGEDKGLGRLIARECDFLVRIPMRPEITSLNTSVAASLLLYEAVRQRDQK